MRHLCRLLCVPFQAATIGLVKRAIKTKHLTDLQWAKAVEQYSEGRSAAKIARYFRTSRMAVIREMMKRGIKKPPPIANKRAREIVEGLQDFRYSKLIAKLEAFSKSAAKGELQPDQYCETKAALLRLLSTFVELRNRLDTTTIDGAIEFIPGETKRIE